MNLAASVITSFGNAQFEIHGRKMIEGFTKNWPAQIPLLVVLDDDLLIPDVTKLLRPQDACAVHNNSDRKAFLERNKGRDDPTNYRKQALRFCHKVFALKNGADFWKSVTGPEKARYLIWLDADVLITRPVSLQEIVACLPEQGAAVSYMGRKDWDHSECGWMGFDLQSGGNKVIDDMVQYYITDKVFDLPQWHDSFIFDQVLAAHVTKGVEDFSKGGNPGLGFTNLTRNKPGMEIWPQSPMAAWSRHYKGPIAKQELGGPAPKQPAMMPKTGGIQIQTKNSIPNENIQRNILENQAQIKQWVRGCVVTDEEIVVASAGPMLIPEDLQAEVDAGRKIVAVKHALEPLEAAGIKPWACILLDPREHVAAFVDHPDKDVLWFVASQVTPKAVKKLLDAGCTVWGYHAAVGADEEQYTQRQSEAVVSGGSATATRGLFLLDKLGFRNFRLYGYDLCFPDKPNMDERDEFGQPKHFEVSIDAKTPHYKAKKAFWSKAELLAQYQEMNDLLGRMPWKVHAFGHGIVPFLTDAKRVSDLREASKKGNLVVQKPVSYDELLGCRNKTHFLQRLRRILPKTRLKPKQARSS